MTTKAILIGAYSIVIAVLAVLMFVVTWHIGMHATIAGVCVAPILVWLCRLAASDIHKRCGQ